MTWFRSKRKPEPFPPSFFRNKKIPINQTDNQVTSEKKENEPKPITPNNKL